MESEDLHYHLQQHEDHHHHQHVGFLPSSSSSPSSDTYGVHENNHHSWTPNTTLSSKTLGSSTITSQRNEVFHDPSFNNCPMTQHMGFNWATNSQIPEVKQELSLLNHDLFPKLTDLLNSPSSIEDLRLGPSSHMEIKNDDDDQQEVAGNEYLSELSQKLMLKTLSSSSSHMMMMYGSQRAQVGEDYGGSCGAASRENHISQIIHPSINVSRLNINNGQSSSPSGIMSMSSSDFLHPSRSISQDGLGLIGESSPNNLHAHDYGRDRMSALSNSKTSEAKRSNSSNMDVKGPLPPKKSRVESRASCPPIKVRKEKLGERIAALQQLVAPFGKTDTASVLMEAIGYIKFLQNQVQALSVPYMKHSRSEAINRSTHMVSKDDENDRPKRDLRSRGLCLVPLSCMSYVMTNDGSGGGGGCGGGIWLPPPNFTQGR